MRQSKAEQIAESFINGNISWCKVQLYGKRKLTCQVIAWLKEYAPNELESFLRIMS